MTPLGPPWWKILIPFLMWMIPWAVAPKQFSVVPDKILAVQTWDLPGCDTVVFETEKQTGVVQTYEPVPVKCYYDPLYPSGMTASTILRFYGTDGYVYRIRAIPHKNSQPMPQLTPHVVEGWWYMGSNPPPGVQGAPYPPPVR